MACGLARQEAQELEGNMKKIILAISVAIAMAGIAVGQNTTTRARTTASSNTSASKKGRQINLDSGTQLAGQLESSLDARHAKPGDQVVLKTITAVKQNGETIVPKGSRLIGHVTDVQQQSKSSAESRLGVVFDSLRTGSTETPITASILSITQARAQASNASNNDLFGSDTMAQSSSSARTSSSAGGQRSGGGGLLGGVGNTVGGVANTTTSTIGNVAGSSTNAVGNTVGATTSVAGNSTGALRGLQITQSSDASASGGSSLSLTGRNLHLDSGTTFNLAVSNSTSEGNNQ
jgi:hypothetical protein